MKSLKRAMFGRGTAPTTPLLALDDVSFRIPHGQTVAVVGRNGSGKSTLLGIIARVYKPSKGSAAVFGPDSRRPRIAPLLALGAGFHRDLTGLENIEFYGAILGLTPREINEKRPQILAFAELEEKADTVIRGWNDGARLRLGFAIAVHTDPDLLLVDEVLAVGDESFQNKCYRLIDELQAAGKTILFVTHDLTVAERTAGRVLWINAGKLVMDGSPAEVLTAYRQSSEEPAP
jgi:ABC-type polysaccharide/polyol phosphate transport system ATPase subunit